MGETAVLINGLMTLIVTSRRLFPVSLEQYAACNIDVARYRYVIAKGVHAPIAAYESLKAHVHPRQYARANQRRPEPVYLHPTATPALSV